MKNLETYEESGLCATGSRKIGKKLLVRLVCGMNSRVRVGTKKVKLVD